MSENYTEIRKFMENKISEKRRSKRTGEYSFQEMTSLIKNFISIKRLNITTGRIASMLLLGAVFGLFMVSAAFAAENAPAAVAEKQEAKKPAATAVDKMPGSILVTVTDAEGKPVKGVSVTIYLPGKDGSLDKNPNLSYEIADGDKNDGEKTKNGRVLLKASKMKNLVSVGDEFEVVLKRNGAEDAFKRQIYKTGELNKVDFAIKK
jgi:hypothetical protein